MMEWCLTFFRNCLKKSEALPKLLNPRLKLLELPNQAKSLTHQIPARFTLGTSSIKLCWAHRRNSLLRGKAFCRGVTTTFTERSLRIGRQTSTGIQRLSTTAFGTELIFGFTARDPRLSRSSSFILVLTRAKCKLPTRVLIA